MQYNPRIHHRRSIRLKGYDYSQAGLYFITICCQNMVCRFGTIKNEQMILNGFGQIANNNWLALSERFPNITLDVFQIMPNHMHGIIILNDVVGAGLAPAQNAPAPNTPNPNQTNSNQTNPEDQNPEDQNTANFVGAGLAPAQNTDAQTQATMPCETRAEANPAPTIGDIVGAYKSLVANGCLEIYKSNNQMMGKLWQRDYYEHIIRNEQSYQTISHYIINNPANWNGDKFNTA